MKMNLLHLIFLVVIIRFNVSDARYGVIISETFENCSPQKRDAKALDFSNFEVIAETDTDVYMNGSVKFRRSVGSKTGLHIFYEKFIRSQWNVEVFNANRSSFCASIQNPTEGWYMKTKKLKGYPLKAEVRQHSESVRISSSFV
jgi:hypothetical protein